MSKKVGKKILGMILTGLLCLNLGLQAEASSNVEYDVIETDAFLDTIEGDKALLSADGKAYLYEKGKLKKEYTSPEGEKSSYYTYLDYASHIVEGHKPDNYILEEYNFDKEVFEKVDLTKYIEQYKNIKQDIINKEEIPDGYEVVGFDIWDGHINSGYIIYDIDIKRIGDNGYSANRLSGVYKDGKIVDNEGDRYLFVKELSDRVYINRDDDLIRIDSSGSTCIYDGSLYHLDLPNYKITDDEKYIIIEDVYMEYSQKYVGVKADNKYEITPIYGYSNDVNIEGNSLYCLSNKDTEGNEGVDSELLVYSSGSLINRIAINNKIWCSYEWPFSAIKYGNGFIVTTDTSRIVIPKENIKLGWNNIDGKWYYYNESGDKKTGWLNDNGLWYYLNESGAMETGWLNNGGTWYYLNESGAMETGWLNDNGTWYYLNQNGSMATNTVVDGWKIDASGVATPL